MKSILDIYSHLNNFKNERFIEECFVADVYGEARPKLTVVDLGGYTGEFSFMCLPFASKVFCVEPDPVPFTRLQGFVEEFQCQDKMKIFQFAITANGGKTNMTFSGAGGSTLDPYGTPVDSYSFEEFMKMNEIEHIDILKVDIESAEAEIFASDNFARNVDKIDLIIGEHGGFSLLTKYGFTIKDCGAGVYLAKR